MVGREGLLSRSIYSARFVPRVMCHSFSIFGCGKRLRGGLICLAAGKRAREGNTIGGVVREQAVMFWYPRNGEHPNVSTATVVLLVVLVNVRRCCLFFFFYAVSTGRRKHGWEYNHRTKPLHVGCWMLAVLFIFS